MIADLTFGSRVLNPPVRYTGKATYGGDFTLYRPRVQSPEKVRFICPGWIDLGSYSSLVVIILIASEHGSFNLICQVTPIEYMVLWARTLDRTLEPLTETSQMSVFYGHLWWFGTAVSSFVASYCTLSRLLLGWVTVFWRVYTTLACDPNQLGQLSLASIQSRINWVTALFIWGKAGMSSMPGGRLHLCVCVCVCVCVIPCRMWVLVAVSLLAVYTRLHF